jgi:hypothetical protein
MPDLIPFASGITALLGALIGSGAALLGQWLTSRRQFKLEALKDRRALQVARRERLQGTYETVLQTAMLMKATTGRLTFLLAFESPESRKSRGEEVRELLGRTEADLDQARVRLILDRDGAATVYPIFESMRATFNELWDLQGNTFVPWTHIGEKRREVERAVDALRQAMVDSLAQLDRRIDELAVATAK